MSGSLDEAKAAGDATEALEAQLAEIKEQLATKDQATAEANAALDASKTALEQAQQDTASEAQLEEIKEQLAVKEQATAEANAALEESKSALEQAQQETASANDKVEALEAQLAEAKNVSENRT